MSEFVCSWEELNEVVVRAVDGKLESVKEVYNVVTSKEVVRCRDCKYSTEEGIYAECCFCHLDRWNSNLIEASPVEPDGFCAWGERKYE